MWEEWEKERCAVRERERVGETVFRKINGVAWDFSDFFEFKG